MKKKEELVGHDVRCSKEGSLELTATFYHPALTLRYGCSEGPLSCSRPTGALHNRSHRSQPEGTPLVEHFCTGTSQSFASGAELSIGKQSLGDIELKHNEWKDEDEKCSPVCTALEALFHTSCRWAGGVLCLTGSKRGSEAPGA